MERLSRKRALYKLAQASIANYTFDANFENGQRFCMDDKLNIAVVAACPFPAQRGTPVRIFRTCEALGRKGHNIHVVTYHFGDPAVFDAFTVHRIPAVIPYNEFAPGPSYSKLLLLDPMMVPKLYKLLTSNDIDIIHAHHYESLIIALLVRRFTGHPVVYDAHTILESELPSYSLFLPVRVKRHIGEFIDGWFPRRAQHSIVATEQIGECLIQKCGLNDANVTVIGNGIERQVFLEVHGEHPKFRHDSKRIIYTGNFAEFQRVDLLLKAFREIVDIRPDVRLCIVSTFPFDKFEPLAAALNIRENIDVIKAGFEDVPAYLKNADVAANPRTLSDGFPQKLANYMASGTPVVSFEGSAKLISHGETGWVVEDENVTAFAQGLLKMLEDKDLAARVAENAREYVLSELTWEKAADKIEAVYRQVLE